MNRRGSRISHSESSASVTESKCPPLKSPLSLRRLQVNEIPSWSEDSPDNYENFARAIFADAEGLLAELPSWPEGQKYDKSGCEVKTGSRKSRRGERQAWHYRWSTHDRPISDFDKLFYDHAENEEQYIDACQNVRLLQTVKAGEASIHYAAYKQPFPISNRDFVHLIICRKATDGNGFVIVQAPVDHPNGKSKRGHVRAAYTSVERVRKLESGTVEWVMVTTSEAGGNIPAAMTDKFLPMQIALDPPSYIDWIEGKPKGKKKK